MMIAKLDENDDIAEIKSAMEHIISHFREPLEAASINLAGIQDELEEVVEYARKYVSIYGEPYQKLLLLM